MLGHMNLPPQRIPLFRDTRRPRHTTHRDEELVFHEIHTHADAAAVPEDGVVLDRGVFGEGLAVGGVRGVEPAVWVKDFGAWVDTCVARDGPLIRVDVGALGDEVAVVDVVFSGLVGDA